MAIYGNNNFDTIIDEDFDMEEYEQNCLYTELATLPGETLNSFLESEECAMLEAKGLISRKTIIRLNKKDDLERRTNIAAYQLAKQKGDALWTKFLKHRRLEKKYAKDIKKKYRQKAEAIAKKEQRNKLTHKLPQKLLTKSDLEKGRERR